jgi:serine/threonine protein phosphatase PrpC
VYAVTPRNVAKDSTCIAMTRALGDFYAHQFGLCAEPSIGVQRIDYLHSNVGGLVSSSSGDGQSGQSALTTSNEWTIVLASDGVWDVWRYEDFSLFINESIYKKNLNLHDLGEHIIEESIHRAVMNFGNKHYDDAAVVIWQFKPTTIPPTSAAASPPIGQ